MLKKNGLANVDMIFINLKTAYETVNKIKDFETEDLRNNRLILYFFKINF